MLHYFENFISGWHQLAAIAAVLTVWIGFLAIGAVAGGRHRNPDADVLTGWALVSLLFVAGGALLQVPFTFLAMISVLVAAGCLFIALRANEDFQVGNTAKLLLLALPMLVLVSGMRVSQWDEFTDWALIPRLLLSSDAFPSRDNPFPGHAFVAYPYSWHFVSYLAGRVAGGFVESTGPLMNTLLLYGFGLVSLRMVATAFERPDWVIRPVWHLIALGVLTATLLNPTFAQKVAMTSYADVPAAVATGVATVLGWQMLEAMRADDRERTRALMWQFGLVLMLLMNLKQATLVLFVLITCATFFIGLRDPQIRLRPLLTAMAGAVVPGLLIYVLWRYHVSQELAAGEFTVRPLAQWYINLIPDIIARMALVLTKKGYFAVLLICAVIFGIRGLFRCRTPFDRFAAIVVLTVLGYEAFLLFAYVASFGEGDALRAASFWRYNMHVGLIVLAFGVYGAALLWRRYLAGRMNAPWLAWLPIVLVLALPFAFADKIRFDREPWVVHYRETGAKMVPLIEQGAQIYVFDPMGSGESAGITGYEVLGHAAYTGYTGAYHPVDVASLRKAATTADGRYLAVYSVNAALAEVLGLEAKGGQSYLMKQDDTGAWKVIAAWPHPLPGR